MAVSPTHAIRNLIQHSRLPLKRARRPRRSAINRAKAAATTAANLLLSGRPPIVRETGLAEENSMMTRELPLFLNWATGQVGSELLSSLTSSQKKQRCLLLLLLLFSAGYEILNNISTVITFLNYR